MPDILTLLLGTFALYILMYGVCWGTGILANIYNINYRKCSIYISVDSIPLKYSVFI